jgi:hypothetical protein
VTGGADAFETVRTEQEGVLTTAQATELIGRAALRSHLRQQRWRRICRGLVATHNGKLDHLQQLWVAVLVSGDGALLAGVSAVAESGVRGLRAGSLHVLVPAVRNRSLCLPDLPPDMPPVVVHRTRVLSPEHCQAGRPPRTTLARAVLDAAVWAATSGEARLVLAAACQQRRISADEVLATIPTVPVIRRRGLIHATLLDIAGGAEALSEINFIKLCLDHGLPRPTLQERRRDTEGRRRYLDAYWKNWHLHVEVDGAHHMDVEHWTADMLRQNTVWISGDRILRFPAWLVRERPAEVARQVRSALQAAGWV